MEVHLAGTSPWRAARFTTDAPKNQDFRFEPSRPEATLILFQNVPTMVAQHFRMEFLNCLIFIKCRPTLRLSSL
ncbi:hypothetical protein CXQ80_11105 [Pseudomonas sp. 02C 26]|nr:hypothetical protein CXQ80_11105 [Pseudomonas sp. 02C 26]